MDNAPIDVRYNELLKWMQERYVTASDWTSRLEAISIKKQQVIDELYSRDTPEFKKIQDTFKTVKNEMNYTDIMRLNQMLLKTEEAKNKTFFGSYNSSLIKNCVLLVNLYEKNFMHLCESSKILLQNIGYDIPNFEKTIQGNDKSINEIQSKIQEKTSAITKNEEKLKSLFKLYNIKQTNNSNEIALSIIERLSQLPQYLQKLDTLLRSVKLGKIISQYKNFYKKLNEQEIEKVYSQSSSNSNTDEFDFLKTLQKINKEGDYVIPNNNSNSAENIKVLEKTKYSIVGIKLEEYKQKYQSVNVQADLNSDVWNLQLVEQSGSTAEEKYTTALLDSKTRNKLIDDLNEIIIFISLRLSFCNNKDEISLSIYQNNIREINTELNQDTLKESKAALDEIINIFNEKEFEFLSLIFEDERKIKNILNSFESVKTENNNMNKNINELKAKCDEYAKESAEFNKKIQQIKKDSKLIKKNLEKTLTDKMKRKITVIGDVNLF